MKNQAEREEGRDHPGPGLPSGASENRAGEAPEVQARSNPLKSTYDSTFILLVLSVAAILALILIFWPSGGF